MAIKFYRAKALPSSLNSSHDGVWFIKPDGATSFRTYNVKDGVAVGDGFDPNADYLQGKYQSGLYSTLRGQYEDYGFTGIYDRTVTTDADLRGGGVNIDIIEGSCNYAQDPNILIDANATGSGLLLTDCTPDLKIDVIIDNGSQASAHGHAFWQAFFQNRHASEQYAYFSSIKVYVSLDGSSWSTVPNDGWSVDDFNPRVAAYGPAGFWFSRSGTPSPEWQWRYVKFEFRNIVFGTHSTNPDRSYFKALGIRHASEQYARQYLTERRAKGLFDEKVDKTDSRLNDSREWTASTVSQSEAQAGTSTTRRAWTAQRVRQAISGWWNTIVDTIAEKTWVSANFDKYGFWNLKTNGIQRKTIQSGNDVDFVAGDNIGISYGANGKVTIDATNTQYNSMSEAQLQAGTDTQQRVVSAKLLNDWFESQFAPIVIVDDRYPQPFIQQIGTQWGDASESVWIEGHYLKKGSTIKIEHLSHPADSNYMIQFTLGIAIDDVVEFPITDPLMSINPDDIFTNAYIEMYFVEDNEFTVNSVKYIKSDNEREITGGYILSHHGSQGSQVINVPEDGFELKIKSKGAQPTDLLMSLSFRVTFEPSYIRV